MLMINLNKNDSNKDIRIYKKAFMKLKINKVIYLFKNRIVIIK